MIGKPATPARVPSLAGTGELYHPAKIRVVDNGLVRLQWTAFYTHHEQHTAASRKLVQWLLKEPTTIKSFFSNTNYVYCQMRTETDYPGKVRVQIPGKKYNRPWGCSVRFPLDVSLDNDGAGKVPTLPGPSLWDGPTDSEDVMDELEAYASDSKHNWKNFGLSPADALENIQNNGECVVCGASWGKHSGFFCP